MVVCRVGCIQDRVLYRVVDVGWYDGGIHRRILSVADPEFYNGAHGRAEGSGEGAVPAPQKKMIFF